MCVRHALLLGYLRLCASYYWIKSTRTTNRTATPYALCVTEKGGCSELLEYSRWLSLSPLEFCSYETYHSSATREGCNGQQGSTWLYEPSHLVGFDVWPVRGGTTSVLPECLTSGAECDVPTIVVVRGPWERLVSAFVSKYHNEPPDGCARDDDCFRSVFMSTFPQGSEHPFVRYMRALVSTPSMLLNEHFRPQKDMCLHTPRKWSTVADLGDRASLEKLSKAMGADGSGTMGAVMNGAYRQDEDRKRPPDWCWEGCREHIPLIELVRARFAPDIAAISELGMKNFSASFDDVVRECRVANTLCHDRTSFAIVSAASSVARRLVAAQTTLQPDGAHGEVDR